MNEPQSFTSGQRAYLSSLAAVDMVDASSRIHYADWFRIECMRRYREGEKPVDLFRQAGLDPKLVGHKRIERAFARWKRSPEPLHPKPPKPKSRDTVDPYDPRDPRDRLIAAQALRIQQLEEEIRFLKRA
ncbi:hypothetical protein [Bifidobacterium panos]|uniref:Transposase n=1 Tax=Bifidobacterium panos TaxID=2675321 RepID=A0ABX1SY85_9BIFI|nr:hypothetical protein [Bifidobacterium sp. DSM 109963]NMN02087.1 hypothetical protein [Bifidobacterium sp. DSM 109963]